MSPKQDDSGWTERKPTALLVLADGTVLEGFGLGATGQAVGEVQQGKSQAAGRRRGLGESLGGRQVGLVLNALHRPVARRTPRSVLAMPMAGVSSGQGRSSGGASAEAR